MVKIIVYTGLSLPFDEAKEILDSTLNVMKSGVKVYGASSMGALRASELDTLGMVGVGYVYTQYATGEVDSDDDVAVMLDSETLEALSVPLINMKYVFTNAAEENIITEDERDELLKIAKKTFKRKMQKTFLK